MIRNLLIAVALMVSGNAFANFSADDVVEATKLAVAEFKTSVHAEHFVGFKSWKSGGEAKVKIYVNHDGTSTEVNFSCHKHDNEIECHIQ